MSTSDAYTELHPVLPNAIKLHHYTTATNQIIDATYIKAKNVNVCNEFIYKFIQSCLNRIS